MKKLRPITKRRLKSLFLIVFIALGFCPVAQTLSPLEPVSGHYRRLQSLDARSDDSRAALDEITFPMDGRVSGRQFVGLDPTYLQKADYETLKALVSFPANSSAQTRAELDYLLEWEARRTAEHRSRAFEIARVGYWPPLEKDGPYGDLDALFWECRSLAGEACDAKKYPATVKLLAGIMRDVRIAEFTLKFHHKRARPYHLESRLNPMGRVSNPSFASGHTLWAYSQAFTWGELMPDRRDEFIELAYEVGESREIMGIHYPSDEEAARILSHKMLELMMNNQAFVEDMVSAKKEWQ